MATSKMKLNNVIIGQSPKEVKASNKSWYRSTWHGKRSLHKKGKGGGWVWH
jgi:hypothetical protein